MKDIKDMELTEKCPRCGGNITLMASIGVNADRSDPDDMKTFLVKRCLNCGEYPLVEVVKIAE